MREEAVRGSVSKALKGRLTDELWSYLDDMGFVGEVIEGREDVPDLVKKAWGVIRAGAPPDRRVEKMGVGGPNPGSERIWALSEYVASIAADDIDVCSFRRDVLDD
jgi:hypothetical protein